jgi:hypothetical protein
MIENILRLPPGIYNTIITQYREQGLNDEDIMDLFVYKLNCYRVVWSSHIKTKSPTRLYLPKDITIPVQLQPAIKKDKFNEFKDAMRLFKAGIKFYEIEKKLLEIEKDF